MKYKIGQHLIHRQFGDVYSVISITTTETESKTTYVYKVRREDNAQEKVAEMEYNEKMMELNFVNDDKHIYENPGESNRLTNIMED